MGRRTIGSRLDEAAAEAVDYINDLEDRNVTLETELRSRDLEIEGLAADVRGLQLELDEQRAGRADQGPRLRGPVHG